MARARNGWAVGESGRTPEALLRLQQMGASAEAAGDLDLWRRVRAVEGYIAGRTAVDIAAFYKVHRATVTEWLERYERGGAEALRTRKAPGRAPRLSSEQFAELTAILTAGPVAAGFSSGVWTAPMVGQLIQDRFGVKYHNHYVPVILHALKFSVQRPRKKLARANPEAQADWQERRFPELKKRAAEEGSLIAFEDEASFWLDGTLHQTWAPVGQQPRMETFGERKTAHVFGAISIDARFTWQFAPVFSGTTFFAFLLHLVAFFVGRKILLVIDNGSCHWLDEPGKEWLKANPGKIELIRLPPYSPEFNPTEGVWKTTRRRATHNRFYRTVDERDTALANTFTAYQQNPSLIAGHVQRFSDATST